MKKNALTGFTLATVVLGGINALSYWSLERYRETADWVTHTYQVQQTIEITHAALTGAETGQRGYLLTGEESYLINYLQNSSLITTYLQELQSFTADNPNQQRRISALKPLILQRLEALKKVINLRRQKGFEVAIAGLRATQGAEIMTQIRQILNDMEAEEATLLERRILSRKSAELSQNFSFLAGLVFNLLVLVWFYHTVSREINQCEKAQTEARQINEHLEQKIRERTAELEQTQSATAAALEQERELSELKSRVIGIISHEYRTPLAAIASSAELLEHYRNQWGETKQLKHLSRIQSSVKHLVSLVNDVLFLIQAESGNFQYSPEILDIASFFQGLIEDWQSMLPDNIILTFIIKGEPVQYLGDATLLKLIADNLISNAIKYSPDGGEIVVKLDFEGKTIGLWICDEGIGMSLEDQNRLFEPFYRATNVSAIAGTGLGLSIVKKCLDILGGEITVDSAIRKGTAFTVTLPTAPTLEREAEV
jgi:signal transduction histidine kinase